MIAKILTFVSFAHATSEVNTDEKSINREIYIPKAEEKRERGHYQEAAWLLDLVGMPDNSEEIIESLRMVFRSEPISEETWGKGVAKSVLLTFLDESRNTVKGLFKPTSADPHCASCKQGRAVAVYELDRSLGFYLTPLTTWHEFEPETEAVCKYLNLQWSEDDINCEMVKGSIQYFVNNSSTVVEFIDSGFAYNKSDKLHLFDAIIGNSDRHLNNILIDDSIREIAIDHNRTFMYTKEEYELDHNSCWEVELDKIESPYNLAPYISRYLNLTSAEINKMFNNHLDDNEVKLFIDTRKKIAERLSKRLSFAFGKEYVLSYDVCPTVEILAKEYID